MFKEDEPVKWSRKLNSGRGRFTEVTLFGEFQRLVSHKKGYSGKQLALIILDEKFRPEMAPLDELTTMEES